MNSDYVKVAVANFAGPDAVEDASIFEQGGPPQSFEYLQSKGTFEYFAVASRPGGKDTRERDKAGNIIPNVAKIQNAPKRILKLSHLLPVNDQNGKIRYCKSCDQVWNKKVLGAVSFLVKSEKLSLSSDGQFSIVAVPVAFKEWLRKSLRSTLKAMLDRPEWQELTVKLRVEAAKHYYLMLLESMVYDFRPSDTSTFHTSGKSKISCLDHLFLKLWTFSHWVHCERFCAFEHEKKLSVTDFKNTKCEKCEVKSNGMSFFSYYTSYSFDKTKFDEDTWEPISRLLLKAAEKLPGKPVPLYRGLRPPVEGLSLRLIAKDEWRDDVQHDQEPMPHKDSVLQRSASMDAVEKKLEQSTEVVHADDLRNMFADESGSCGCKNVKVGDLMQLDNRVSSFTSDMETAIRYSSHAENAPYQGPSTIIEIENGNGLDNPFSVVPDVKSLRDAELQMSPNDEFVVLGVDRNKQWNGETRDVIRLRRLVNLNTDPQNILWSLRQVGAVRSARIISARENGPFQGFDDFQSRVGYFPSRGRNRRGIIDYVTFGPVALPAARCHTLRVPAKSASPNNNRNLPSAFDALAPQVAYWYLKKPSWNGNMHGPKCNDGTPDMRCGANRR